MTGGTLLAKVRAAGEKVKTREVAVERARDELYAAIMDAYGEGIPIAKIARAAGLSRQWVTHLIHGRDK
jgi:hypothetical protein